MSKFMLSIWFFYATVSGIKALTTSGILSYTLPYIHRFCVSTRCVYRYSAFIFFVYTFLKLKSSAFEYSRGQEFLILPAVSGHKENKSAVV